MSGRAVLLVEDDPGDAFLVGEEFSSFLEEDITTTQETLKTIGLIE